MLDIEDGRVTGFREKPSIGYTVAIGAYALSRTTLQRYPSGEMLGFDQLMRDLIDRGEQPASFDFSGFRPDIGRPEDYDRANIEFDAIRARLLPEG